MAIFKVLEKEHDKVKDLFEKILKSKSPKGKDFDELMKDLDRHMKGEEEIVYPELKKSIEKDLVLEGIEEHRAAKSVKKELQKMSGDEENFQAKMKVLKELIEHHIEEEEGEMFPQAEKKVDKDKQNQMEEKYSKMKN